MKDKNLKCCKNHEMKYESRNEHQASSGRYPNENWKKANLDTYHMGLWPAFLDGMMDAAERAEFVDGYEDYSAQTFEKFRKIRSLIKKDGAVYSANPSRYKKRMRASSSIWLKASEGIELQVNNDDFAKNNHTPEGLEHSIHYAMLNSDGWIWLYSFPWFELPEEYLNAVKNARNPHPLDYDFSTGLPPRDPADETPPDAMGNFEISGKTRADNNDLVVFAAIRKVYKEIYDFPKPWKFRFDREDVGIKKKWYKKYDASDWIDIEIGDWYNYQLKSDYSGYVWYRTTFDVPQEWAGKKLLLAFGAVDEQAWIWINGKKAGESTAGPSTWNSAFEINISKYVKAGQENVIVVRTHNSAGPGGIWKSVKIFTE